MSYRNQPEINELLDNISNITDFDTWLETIDAIENLFPYLTIDQIDKSIRKIIISTTGTVFFREIENVVYDVINNIFVRYIDYLDDETLKTAYAYSILLFKSIIDYKPDTIHNLLKENPTSIHNFVTLELFKDPRYYPWFTTYMPLAIEYYDQRLIEVEEKYTQDVDFVRNLLGPAYQSDISKLNPNDMKTMNFIIHNILNYKRRTTDLKGYIKQYYYIIAKIKIDTVVKSDLDKEWIIRYFIRADDYEDSQLLRDKFIRQYYSYQLIPPINSDENTLIQLLNYIKNNCR